MSTPPQFIRFLKSFYKANLDIKKHCSYELSYNYLKFGDFESPFIFYLHNLKNIILILNIIKISFLMRFVML